MTLSIALCTYNGAQYLPHQLESYLSQTRRPDELVVCDDRSEDETLSILDAFARRAPFPVRVSVNEARLGYSENFIRAIGRCRGDVIATSDQDDLWLPHKLATVLDGFRDDEITSVIHTMRVADEVLTPSDLILPVFGRTGRFGHVRQQLWFTVGGLVMAFRSAVVAPFLAHPRVLSKWWPSAAPFDEWVHFIASAQGDTGFLPEPLILYRQHAKTVTADPRITFSRAFQRKLLWSTGSDQYEHFEKVAESRAQFARTIAGETSGVRASTSRGVAAYYDQVAAFYRGRVAIYRPGRSRSSRLRSFVRLTSRGGYRSRYTGGLGGRSMLKDLFVVCCR